METKYKIEGHTVEIRVSSTGSCDPWSLEYAQKIKLSRMCTADMAEFMLVDGEHVFRIENWGAARDLRNLVKTGAVADWSVFKDQWLMRGLADGSIMARGTLSEARGYLDEARRRERVWKAMPQAERRKAYEHLKTLGPEAVKAWYRERYKALGIE